MSASLNETRLLGHLGTDPEVKHLESGKTVATFRLATNDEWTDAAGGKQSRTDWHTVEVWGAQAKTVGQYLTKGRQVLVLGALRYDLWEKDGVKHSRAKVVASRVLFLDTPHLGDPERDVAGDHEPSSASAPA